jgi:hypothetical protein
MSTRYDLFRIDDGGPVWVGTAATMHEVKLKVQQLAVASDSEWLLYDQLTGNKSVLTREQFAEQLAG